MFLKAEYELNLGKSTLAFMLYDYLCSYNDKKMHYQTMNHPLLSSFWTLIHQNYRRNIEIVHLLTIFLFLRCKNSSELSGSDILIPATEEQLKS